MNLVDIGKKYPSSKNISGFIQLYDKYFTPYRELEINILEIGVIMVTVCEFGVNIFQKQIYVG